MPPARSVKPIDLEEARYRPVVSKSWVFLDSIWNRRTYPFAYDANGGIVVLLMKGRISNGVSVIIEGEIAADTTLWEDIREFAQSKWAKSLVIERIGGEHATPPIANESFRASASIYVVNLQTYAVSTSLNRKLKKAKGTSIRLVETPPDQALSNHLEARNHSSLRRAARGEDINEPADLPQKIEIATKLGRARFFTAVEGGEVLSSVFILLSGKSAYYFTGGTSARGMDTAAAYFCLAGAMEILRSEGYETLNLGIVSHSNPGLAQFKGRLGGQPYPYERIHATYPGLPVFRSVLSAIRKAGR